MKSLEQRLQQLEASRRTGGSKVIIHSIYAHSPDGPVFLRNAYALVIGDNPMKIPPKHGMGEDDFVRFAYACMALGKHLDQASNTERRQAYELADAMIAEEENEQP